jgi:hypothetical protein
VIGNKVGTVFHVYRAAAPLATVGGGTRPGRPDAEPAIEDVVEVSTGVLGLGPSLYIPCSAIEETLDDCVFIAEPKDAFERLGWQGKPAHLDQLQ